jgi:phosphocarrier protein
VKSKTAPVSQEVTILNERGLHARAAAKVARLASQYKSNIDVARAGTNVPAASLMGLLMLGASKGTAITITAQGDDAPQALANLVALIERKFDEE